MHQRLGLLHNIPGFGAGFRLRPSGSHGKDFDPDKLAI